MKKKSVCVIGLGYIGLPTAVILAQNNFKVFGFDKNKKIVSSINNGYSHIAEPGLSSALKSAVRKFKLKAFNKIQKSNVYIICVPTPFKKTKKIPSPNINFVLSAVKDIMPILKKGDMVILESTSPLGTTEKIYKMLKKFNKNTDKIHIAYCPERVLPGKILKELKNNDRIIGGINTNSNNIISKFYRSFVKGNVIETDSKTAEMCKLVENSFRDLNIAFANELSMICDNKGIDVQKLIKLANRHPRVNILEPGTGVGGHCIAVDPWFLISQDIKNSNLIRKAREVNINKTYWVLKKIKELIKKFQLKYRYKPKIACLGLAFKPNVDDLRESTALKIVESLVDAGHKVLPVEPNIKLHPKLKLFNFKKAIKEADLIFILVKHKEFTKFNFKNYYQNKNIIDFCGSLSR